MLSIRSQVGQGTANEVELRDLRAELEGKEEKYEQEKDKQTSTAQGAWKIGLCWLIRRAGLTICGALVL